MPANPKAAAFGPYGGRYLMGFFFMSVYVPNDDYMRQDWRQTGGYSFPLPTFLVHRGILRSASLYNTPPAFLCNIVQALFLTVFDGIQATFTRLNQE